MTCLTCPACGYEIVPPPNEFLAVGNLAMNAAYSMAYADGLIRLPRKQGLVLAALMRDPERPLPLAHLLDASDIWNSPHSLIVYICRLRKTIGHVAEIRTHLGYGYSIHPSDEAGLRAATRRVGNFRARSKTQPFAERPGSEIDRVVSDARQVADERRRRQTIELEAWPR